MSSPMAMAVSATPSTKAAVARHPKARPNTNSAATCVVGAQAMKTKAAPGESPPAMSPAATGMMASEQA